MFKTFTGLKTSFVKLYESFEQTKTRGVLAKICSRRFFQGGIVMLILVLGFLYSYNSSTSEKKSSKDTTEIKEEAHISAANTVPTGASSQTSSSLVVSSGVIAELAEMQKNANNEALIQRNLNEYKEQQARQQKAVEVEEERKKAAEAEQAALKKRLDDEGSEGGNYSSVMSLDEAKQNEQFQVVVAIVRQEGGPSYEGAYAVISSAYNRCRSKKWQRFGKSIYKQLTAGGQFSWGISKYHDNCKKYLDMSNVNAQVIQACYDVMYGGKQPMHNFCSFRSTSETKRQGQEILGNTYFDPLEQ